MDWKRDENSLVQWLANFVLLELPPWDDADILSAPMSAHEVVHVMERMKRARGHDSGRTGELVKVMMPPFLPSDWRLAKSEGQEGLGEVQLGEQIH